jgi:hypothetical protein
MLELGPRRPKKERMPDSDKLGPWKRYHYLMMDSIAFREDLI